MIGKWVGAFVLVAFVASALYFANSKLSQQQTFAVQSDSQTAAFPAAIAAPAFVPPQINIAPVAAPAVYTQYDKRKADAMCPRSDQDQCYFTGNKAKEVCDNPNRSKCDAAAPSPEGPVQTMLTQTSQTAAAYFAIQCTSPEKPKKNLSVKPCFAMSPDGKTQITEGHCIAFDDCRADKVLAKNAKGQMEMLPAPKTEVAGVNQGSSGGGQGRILSTAGKDQETSTQLSANTRSKPGDLRQQPIQQTQNTTPTTQQGPQQIPANDRIAALANQGDAQGNASQLVSPRTAATPALQNGQQALQPGQQAALQPTGGGLAVNTPARLAGYVPPPITTAQTTFSNFNYAGTSGGILSSPLTRLTSGLAPGGVFGNAANFFSGLLSGLSSGGNYSSQTVVYQSSADVGGASANSGAGANGGGNFANPNTAPRNLIIVVPGANGPATADAVAQQNIHDLLALARSGPNAPLTSPSFSILSATPASGVATGTEPGSFGIFSAYDIGVPAGGGEGGSRADAEVSGSGASSFGKFLNLSWATPTAVTIGVPVSLSAGPPASSVFDTFNAGRAAYGPDLAQRQGALAQAQLDYESTQAQLGAWQQLQDVGLCGSDCESMIAALESRGWQQQARVDALVKDVEAAVGGAQVGGQAAFGSRGSGGLQGLPLSGGAVSGRGSSVQAHATATAPGAAESSPTTIAAYAAQRDTNTNAAGFDTPQAPPPSSDTAPAGGLAGLPAGIAAAWQNLSNILGPSAAVAQAQRCSLLNSLFSGCGQ